MSDWPSSGATFATPTVTLDDTAAEGSAPTAVRSDATLPAFDDGVEPTASAPGDAGDPGDDPWAARRDHKHPREARVIVMFDDFSRQWGATPGAGYLGIRTLDALPWVKQQESGTGASIRDSLSVGSGPYTDTGFLVMNIGTTSGNVLIVNNGDIGVDNLSIYAGLRSPTEYHFGVGFPTGSHIYAHFGIMYEATGNSAKPDFAADIVVYKGSSDFDTAVGDTINFHNFGSKQDFVALRLCDMVGGTNRDLYYITSATSFIAASASSVLDAYVLLERSGGNYNVTAFVEGLGNSGPLTRSQDRVIGWIMFGARSTQAPSSEKFYFDYFASKRAAPVGLG